MKDEWNDYLKDIGFEQAFLERTNLIYGCLQKIHPDDVSDIFVSEYVDKEQKRIYENIWFFSENNCFEAKSFIATLNLDAASIKDNIAYWNFEAENYDFENHQQASRLNLGCTLRSTTNLIIKASSNNCDYLMRIFSKHILPNFNKTE